jgi:holliday junction DNA helicase RuvA
MIYSLRGVPTKVDPFFVVLEAGGVGYGARIPGNVYEAIVAGRYDTAGKEFTLVTRSVYSEDNAQLFGFLSEDEASLFDFIRSLNGFGPQAAMGIISTIGADALFTALLAQDVAALVKVPGVGKTKAEKLCFEANAKKARLEKLAEGKKTGKTAEKATADDLVVQALVSLGYSVKEIQGASEKLKKSADKPAVVTRENLQEWIRLYLRNL